MDCDLWREKTLHLFPVLTHSLLIRTFVSTQARTAGTLFYHPVHLLLKPGELLPRLTQISGIFLTCPVQTNLLLGRSGQTRRRDPGSQPLGRLFVFSLHHAALGCSRGFLLNGTHLLHAQLSFFSPGLMASADIRQRPSSTRNFRPRQACVILALPPTPVFILCMRLIERICRQMYKRNAMSIVIGFATRQTTCSTISSYMQYASLQRF
jgi:hypothetical protein